MCGQQAGWMLQDVPPWLTQSLLGNLLGTLPALDPDADNEPDTSE